MKEYKNTILIRDLYDEHVGAIIQTNESIATIQDAIWQAKNEYNNPNNEKNIDKLGFIHCEYDYIYYCLCEKYEIEFLENWYDNNVYF
jgi:hypothetical protein